MAATNNTALDPASYRMLEEQSFFVTEKPELGQHEFLTLLVAQLENQDPLEPVQDTEFIAQLATFSSLEELQDLNTRMDSMLDSQAMMVNSQSMNLVGQQVVADTGGTVQLRADGAEGIIVDLVDPPSSARIEILDNNGGVVRTIELDEQQLAAGRHRIDWDGLDDEGHSQETGIYGFRVVVTDETGAESTVDGLVSLPVEGLNVGDGGLFLISGNRILALDEISEIGAPPANNETTE